MKKYTFVTMNYKRLKGCYFTDKESGSKTHREVITEMASQGYKLVCSLPCTNNIDGFAQTYDLVFEKDV